MGKRGKRRNHFVKKWVLEVLSASERPLTANTIVARIKEMRRKVSPCEPRISSVRICKVALAMPEVKRTRDEKHRCFVYSVKGGMDYEDREGQIDNTTKGQ